MATGYLWDEIFGWHDTGSGSLFPADPLAGLQPITHHVAHPDTKRRMHELICVSGLIDHLTRIDPRKPPTRRSCASTRRLSRADQAGERAAQGRRRR